MYKAYILDRLLDRGELMGESIRSKDTEKVAVLASATEINATELRASARSILERAKYQGEQFIVYTHGQPMAVVIGVEEFVALTRAYPGSTPQKPNV